MVAMPLSAANRVWNRTALEAGGRSPCAGDAALAALLLVHGMIMNGGMSHAVESLRPGELESGRAGCRYFGLHSAADTIERALRDDSVDREASYLEYLSAVPSDDVIFLAFEAAFRSDPAEFAPLESDESR